MVLSFKPSGLPAHLLPRAFGVPQTENTPINVSQLYYCRQDSGIFTPSPKTTNCDKQRLLWEHICLVATAELSRLLPSHPPVSGSLCMRLERCPRVLCVRTSGQEELRKDRDFWSYGAQSLQVTELLEDS